jgi:LacI family transcriptional regulator
VAEALHYIRQYVAERLNVARTAAALAVQRRLLEQKCRTHLGTSVLAQIHRARVNEAKELLAVTDLKVSQIARRSGFSTAQRLAVVFWRVTGVAPNVYRRQSRLREE